MTRRTGTLLLVLGLLATAGLVYWALDDSADDGGFALEDEAPQPAREDAGAPDRPAPPSAEGVRRRDGVARILPPDAAIEDVRDALALRGDEKQRELQTAYEAIARTVEQDAAFARSLRKYLLVVDDPVVRGAVLAALGANRSDANIDWLSGRLRGARTNEERIGAFLGLTYAADTPRSTCTTLGGLRHPGGALPTKRTVLANIAGFIDSVTREQAPDVLQPLANAVKKDVAVAALLVVDDTRVCKLYASLEEGERKVMRTHALRHNALPGAVRRVLEAAD